MEKSTQIKQEREGRKLSQSGRSREFSGSKGVAKYLPQHDVQQEVTKRLAVFVGANNVPNNIVGNPDLISVFHALNPSYVVPGNS